MYIVIIAQVEHLNSEMNEKVEATLPNVVVLYGGGGMAVVLCCVYVHVCVCMCKFLILFNRNLKPNKVKQNKKIRESLNS